MGQLIICVLCNHPTRLGFNIGGVPVLPCTVCGEHVLPSEPDEPGEVYPPVMSSLDPDKVVTLFDRDWNQPHFAEPAPELIEPDFLDDGSDIDDMVLSPNKEQDDGPAIGGLWVMAMPHGQTIGWG